MYQGWFIMPNWLRSFIARIKRNLKPIKCLKLIALLISKVRQRLFSEPKWHSYWFVDEKFCIRYFAIYTSATYIMVYLCMKKRTQILICWQKTFYKILAHLQIHNVVAIMTLISYVGNKTEQKSSLYKNFTTCTSTTWWHCDNPSGRAAAVHLQLQNLLCLIHQLGQAYAHMHIYIVQIYAHMLVQLYKRTHAQIGQTCAHARTDVQLCKHTCIHISHYAYIIKAPS